MNTERSDLERRAARHAALGDPVRLRIADLLSVGDLSPSELQSRLSISSNLLAHHVGVLVEAGLAERTRSEGDRRRSYVRLVPGALDGLGPSAAAAARRVVFVCTANSARSQLAAALWGLASEVPAASAGTRPAAAVDPGALAAARRRGIPLAGARPAHVDDVLSEADVVVTVCDSAHEELGARGDLHWSVPDPVRIGTPDAFDDAIAALAERIDSLAPRLTAV